MSPNATIHGTSGPPVLLLPGGAESADGFFPGLVEGLLADPGCRVIVWDRPGTGTSTEPGTLADSGEAVGALIEELGLGPVVLVSQSLGGAVAMLAAIAHPEHVAGLVLLDPTPLNDPRGCAQLERVMRASKALYRVPGLRRLIQSQLASGMRRSMKGKQLRPECAEALDRIGNLDVGRLADAVAGITALSASFREEALPHLPTTIVTADRKPGSSITASHQRVADALGIPLVSWPDSAHNVQLDHPDETLDAVRSLVALAGTAR